MKSLFYLKSGGIFKISFQPITINLLQSWKYSLKENEIDRHENDQPLNLIIIDDIKFPDKLFYFKRNSLHLYIWYTPHYRQLNHYQYPPYPGE